MIAISDSKTDYQCIYFGFCSYYRYLSCSWSWSSSQSQSLTKPGPVIFLVPALVPVPSYFWSRPWSQFRSKNLVLSHSAPISSHSWTSKLQCSFVWMIWLLHTWLEVPLGRLVGGCMSRLGLCYTFCTLACRAQPSCTVNTQRSMVKDHTFLLFNFGTLPLRFCSKELIGFFTRWLKRHISRVTCLWSQKQQRH